MSDDAQAQRLRQCLSEVADVLKRHNLSGCTYVAEVEARDDDCFALYGETQSLLMGLTPGQKQAMALQAMRHIKAVGEDMLRDSCAGQITEAHGLADLNRVANSDDILH